MKMKLVLVLLVTFLVSADSKSFGGWFKKLPVPELDLGSMVSTIACKLPVISSLFSCDKPNPKAFCGKYDCPDFYEEKLNVSGRIVTNYTLRCYPKPYKWVATTYDGINVEKGEAFMRLFRYIQGANEEKMTIDMTVPVTMQMQPNETSSSVFKDNYTMSFFIPFKHQEDAPAPSVDNVRLTHVEPFCAYVMSYGGYSNKYKKEKNYQNLVKTLKNDGFGDDFYTDVVYSAGYASPMKFWNRHNEIWLISKKHSPVN